MRATEVFGAQDSLGILASHPRSTRRSAGIRGERQSSELSVARLTMTPDLIVVNSNQSVKIHLPAVRGTLRPQSHHETSAAGARPPGSLSELGALGGGGALSRHARWGQWRDPSGTAVGTSGSARTLSPAWRRPAKWTRQSSVKAMAGVLAPGWTDGWRRWEWTEPFMALTSLVS